MNDYSASSPDTARVKMNLKMHRTELDNILKESNFSIKATGSTSPMKTPKTVSFNTRQAPPMSAGPTPMNKEAISDLVLYKDSALTFLVVIIGALSLSFGHFMLRGDHNMTLLSAFCYSMLAALAFNFLRSLLSLEQAGDLRGSPAMRTMIDLATRAIETAAKLHDTFLNSRDPKISLKVASGLWALTFVGRYMSIWNVVSVLFVLAFTLPVTYTTHKDTILGLYKQATGSIKGRWAGLGLTRKQQALVLSLGLVIMWMNSSWSSRLVGALIGALVVRINLKPAEVVALRQHAEPFTSVVKKRAARLSIAATDLAFRTLGAKSHGN